MSLLLLLLNGALMAGIYAFAKAGTTPALGVLAWQLLFATLVVGAVAQWRGELPPIGRATLRYAGIAGLLGVSLPSLATFCAITQLPAGLVGAIGALAPLFTYALALASRVERLQPLRALGLGLGLAGVLALLRPEAALPDLQALPWALLAIAAPLLLAAGNLFRTLAWPPGLAPLGAASLVLGLQAAVVVPLALVTGDFVLPLLVDGAGDLALLGGGLLTAAFHLGAFELQRRAGPVVVGQLGYVITAVSLLIGVFVFGERYGVSALLAVATVFAGVVLVHRGAGRPGAPR
jgi:drug/metabolite transporter (DMT)-like permease